MSLEDWYFVDNVKIISNNDDLKNEFYVNNNERFLF